MMKTPSRGGRLIDDDSELIRNTAKLAKVMHHQSWYEQMMYRLDIGLRNESNWKEMDDGDVGERGLGATKLYCARAAAHYSHMDENL